MSNYSPVEIEKLLGYLARPERALLQRLIDPQPAKRLLDFTCATYPGYKPEPFHAIVAEHLDAVVNDEIDRLIISAPPQHGKSELSSVRFPAFWLGRRPDDPIMISSYAASLAEDKSSQVRDIVESEEFGQIFQHIKTREDSRAVAMWKLEGHRGYTRAAGVGGGLTGHGAKCGIIDDPVKDWEEAKSPTIREKVWNWYKTSFRNRIWPGGKIIVIMCMTGDTPVLMANGTERPLRDIRPGDRVATYDKGKLNVTTVRRHKSNGLDSVYRIKTTCGKTVRANARHPFLVSEDGQLKWIRLKNLTTAHRIVILKDSGESGKAKLAQLKAAKIPSAHAGIAFHTTPKKCGLMGTSLHPSIQNPGAKPALNINMVLPPKSTTLCSQLRMGSALSANNHQEKMCAPTGVVNYALTTTTKLTQSEPSCAMTVTSLLDIPKQQQMPSLSLNTSDFTTTGIESIVPAGIEEVFDVQIDYTENFIANGLVSHNTRWDEDDLIGRILNSAESGRWTILRLPAMGETQDERDRNNDKYHLPAGLTDPLGRLPGEALCPELRPVEFLTEIKEDTSIVEWNALYQGAPGAPDGNKIKREWLERAIVDYVPLGPHVKRIRYWDKAATKGGGDYTVGVLMAYNPEEHIFYVEDVVRGQWDTADRNRIIYNTACKDYDKYGNAVTIWHEQEPGSSGKDVATTIDQMLAEFPVNHEPATGSKELRFEPFAAACANGYVRLYRALWNQKYIDELCEFPVGRHDDQADGSSGAYNKLVLAKKKRKVKVH